MSAEQVLQTLGTPSTVSTVGNRNWYYISQISRRRLQFLQEQVVDQRVTAVYFDNNLKVERVALYGLQDGKVFDFISRTTPTRRRGFELRRPDLQGHDEVQPVRGIGHPASERAGSVHGNRHWGCSRIGSLPRWAHFSIVSRIQAPQRTAGPQSAIAPQLCARMARSSSAMMFVILIAGLTAGPAVSL